MRHLLDAHALIWAVDNPSKLGKQSVAVLEQELSIKAGLGKLSLSLPFRQWMERASADLSLSVLPITLEHAERQMPLPYHHRDPFDRLLVAQCLVEDMSLVSADTIFDQYGVNRIWG